MIGDRATSDWLTTSGDSLLRAAAGSRRRDPTFQQHAAPMHTYRGASPFCRCCRGGGVGVGGRGEGVQRGRGAEGRAQRGSSRALLHLARHLHGQSPRSMSLIQLRARIRTRSMIRSIRCSKKGVAPTSSTALTRANGPAATAQGPRRTLTERRANPSTMDVESDVDVCFPSNLPSPPKERKPLSARQPSQSRTTLATRGEWSHARRPLSAQGPGL